MACLVVEAHAVEDVADVLGALRAVRQAAVWGAILAICKATQGRQHRFSS